MLTNFKISGRKNLKLKTPNLQLFFLNAELLGFEKQFSENNWENRGLKTK